MRSLAQLKQQILETPNLDDWTCYAEYIGQDDVAELAKSHDELLAFAKETAVAIKAAVITAHRSGVGTELAGVDGLHKSLSQIEALIRSAE